MLQIPVERSTSPFPTLSSVAQNQITRISPRLVHLWSYYYIDTSLKPLFSDADLTSLDQSEFLLVGHSRAVANLSLGQITLDPIKVNVSTSLNGLKGLQGLTTIEGVDVTGGSQDAINLGINGKDFHVCSVYD